jgi:ankyrin repeat protein
MERLDHVTTIDDQIDQYITQYGDINHQNESGLTLLHEYCSQIETIPLETIQHLIKRGANINAVDANGKTSLHFAVTFWKKHSDSEIMIYLFDQENVNINNPDKYGQTLFHYCCSNPTNIPLNLFKLFIEKYHADINIQSPLGKTPLHLLFEHYERDVTDPNILIYLFNQPNINVSLQNQIGQTVLHAACFNIAYYPFEMVKGLIDHCHDGHGLNIRDLEGKTPPQLAVQYFQPHLNTVGNLIYVLNQPGIDFTNQDIHEHTILSAACNQIENIPLEVFKVLIETCQCDINLQNELGETPLHYTIENFEPNQNSIDALSYLLSQSGVNVNIKDQYGNTLIHLACGNIQSIPIEIFKLLVETCHADFNILNEHKRTPLSMIFDLFQSSPNTIKILEYLCQSSNVDVNAPDGSGRTVLHSFCANISLFTLELFKILIETCHGDLNVQNHQGQTPLHNALKSVTSTPNDLEILFYFLNQPNLQHNCDELLQIACQNCKNIPSEVFKLLIETHGANINPIDVSKNPLRVAFELNTDHHDEASLRYLLQHCGISHPNTPVSSLCFLILSNPEALITMDAIFDTNKLLVWLCCQPTISPLLDSIKAICRDTSAELSEILLVRALKLPSKTKTSLSGGTGGNNQLTRRLRRGRRDITAIEQEDEPKPDDNIEELIECFIEKRLSQL